MKAKWTIAERADAFAGVSSGKGKMLPPSKGFLEHVGAEARMKKWQAEIKSKKS